MKAPNPFAFPWSETRDMVDAEPGMTLRDYFAGIAMGTYLNSDDDTPEDITARWAYAMADAMLAERIKK